MITNENIINNIKLCKDNISKCCDIILVTTSDDRRKSLCNILKHKVNNEINNPTEVSELIWKVLHIDVGNRIIV